MNGQKLAQNDLSGEWKTDKVSKAIGIDPGIYNLYNAVEADRSKVTIGQVIHIDKKENMLYQRKGLQYIKHHLRYFDKIPETGVVINIKYENDKVSISETSKKLSQRMK